MANGKTIKYEDLDQAVKASYSLGIMEGEDNVRNQLLEARWLLVNMLKTNKHLFQLINTREEKNITISPVFTKGVLKVLRSAGDSSRFLRLKSKYGEEDG